MIIFYEEQLIEMDDKWSRKDFTSYSELDLPDNINVYSSCFSQENPDTLIFRDDLVVTFYNCNLDNVCIPVSCILIGCSNKTFQVQNDLEDWIVDEKLQPIEPLNKIQFLRLGLSVDPEDIPAQKLDTSITAQAMEELI